MSLGSSIGLGREPTPRQPRLQPSYPRRTQVHHLKAGVLDGDSAFKKVHELPGGVVCVGHPLSTKPFVGFLSPDAPNLLRSAHPHSEPREKTPKTPCVGDTRRHRGGALGEWVAKVECSVSDLLVGMVRLVDLSMVGVEMHLEALERGRFLIWVFGWLYRRIRVSAKVTSVDTGMGLRTVAMAALEPGGRALD
ncbi:hypothetical protein Cgig2_029633 [Carnegiea gigantea]|uniref:Uncharacterized protein n=1 Tax=Carnegiea gigantea TaxID=171969 RepID=A0A9Q1QIE7_9CARY|nr:hypothetical protein Cgig2_029633 [Carnegiea gigantea]